jgi:hypothetical protein
MWPYYLSLGCSYNEYWNGSAHVAAAYAEAEIYRKERANYEAWLQGLYFNKAVGSALAIAFWNKKGKKPDGYLEYPIAFTEREKEEEKQRRIEATLKFFREGQNQ